MGFNMTVYLLAIVIDDIPACTIPASVDLYRMLEIHNSFFLLAVEFISIFFFSASRFC